MRTRRRLSTPYGPAETQILPGRTRIITDDRLAIDWVIGWTQGQTAAAELFFRRDFWRAQLSAVKPSAARTECDRFVSRWEFTQGLESEVEGLAPEQLARLQAFSLGLNAASRPEKTGPWTIEDSILLARTEGFIEWWEVRGSLAEFLRKAVAWGVPAERIETLFPGFSPRRRSPPIPEGAFDLPLSRDARALIHRFRRFRSGIRWTISNGGPPTPALLGATWISDVTDPGLPLLPVEGVSRQGTVRGLCRHGYPGFWAGKNEHVGWAISPAFDDVIDIRALDRSGPTTLAGFWAGRDQRGTIAAILDLEQLTRAPNHRTRELGIGSVPLDLAIVDHNGGVSTLALGPRWLRAAPEDQWQPFGEGPELPVGQRLQTIEANLPPGLPGKLAAKQLEDWLTRRLPLDLERRLSTLRFLCPDTDRGLALKRWTGSPDGGPEARTLEHITTHLWDELWRGLPCRPESFSPAEQQLLDPLLRLVSVPDSPWLPSESKNRTLGDAVRRGFEATGNPNFALRRTAPGALWTETNEQTPRIFSATVAVVIDPREDPWSVFLTDDETEEPNFLEW